MSENNLHNISDFYHARKVAKDFPPILQQFYKMLQFLEPYRAYTGVNDVCTAIEEAELLMILQKERFDKILNEKGKV